MISYEPFWKTLKSKNLNSYQLKTKYNVNNRLLFKLRHNQPLNTTTIDDLCYLLDCDVGDIMEHKKE